MSDWLLVTYAWRKVGNPKWELATEAIRRNDLITFLISLREDGEEAHFLLALPIENLEAKIVNDSLC